MAILESVRELASKLGAETNGRDITDQINKINKHLDETALGGRDIADAVRTYSKNASGGGGGGETFEVNLTLSVKDQETFDVSSSEAFNDIISAIDNGDKLNLVITVDWGDGSETLSYVMYYKLTKGSTSALLVFGFTEHQSGWFFIQWSGDATTANFREGGMLSVDIIGE